LRDFPPLVHPSQHHQFRALLVVFADPVGPFPATSPVPARSNGW
jgi:hypothetical protein